MKKVSREERARQFMPFAALRGFDEMLKEELAVREEKRELGEDDSERISHTLAKIEKNDFIRVTFYDKTRYRKECGTVTEINCSAGYFKVGIVKVFFDDISEVELLG